MVLRNRQHKMFICHMSKSNPRDSPEISMAEKPQTLYEDKDNNSCHVNSSVNKEGQDHTDKCQTAENLNSQNSILERNDGQHKATETEMAVFGLHGKICDKAEMKDMTENEVSGHKEDLALEIEIDEDSELLNFYRRNHGPVWTTLEIDPNRKQVMRLILKSGKSQNSAGCQESEPGGEPVSDCGDSREAEESDTDLQNDILKIHIQQSDSNIAKSTSNKNNYSDIIDNLISDENLKSTFIPVIPDPQVRRSTRTARKSIRNYSETINLAKTPKAQLPKHKRSFKSRRNNSSKQKLKTAVTQVIEESKEESEKAIFKKRKIKHEKDEAKESKTREHCPVTITGELQVDTSVSKEMSRKPNKRWANIRAATTFFRQEENLRRIFNGVEVVHKEGDKGRKKLFKCPDCSQEMKTLSRLKYHRIIHTGDRPFACDVCGKAYNNRSNLLSHMKGHVVEKTIPCHICGIMFRTVNNMTKHLEIHKEEKFECSICGKKIRRKIDLEKHMRCHTKERPFICEYCARTFSDPSALKRHVATIHTKSNSHLCPLCSQHYSRKDNLKKHMLTVHNVCQ